MESRLYAATLLALYQVSLLMGIALFPVAMLTDRFGLRFPIDRVVTELGEAYDRATA
mgnify:CR=1 FL=1